ncbi:hypothetical protein SALBM311S_06176 [Streptomyces alboniger]
MDAEAVERWADGVAADTGFAEVEHTVELTGICDQCQERSTLGNDFHNDQTGTWS